MYKFIKTLSEKICCMTCAFIVAGFVYLLLLGISDSFSKLIDMGILGMLAVAFTGMLYISPVLIFVGLPYSFLVDFLVNKKASHSTMLKLALYVVLVVLVAVVTMIINSESTSALFAAEMGLASAVGFWLGELIFVRIKKYAKDHNLIKFSTNEI